MSVREIVYKPKGAARALFKCRAPEVLIEGPAGTGKTRACLEYVNFLCETHDGIRAAICRQTRKSMSESVLQTFEDHVLWPGHPAIVGDAGRANRTHYTYPNGSHIMIGGLDKPDRIMSTEFDVVYVAEATETTISAWEKLTTRCRNKKMPWQQSIADCNPGSQYHWLNQRAGMGRMKRLLSRHEDNPHVDAAYLEKLQNLTGARRDRLYAGLWVSEEGLVYDNWDPARHVVPLTPEITSSIKWTFGSIDWGFRNPGCFQVWGVTGDSTLYRLAEVYRAEKTLDWWAEVICELDTEYRLQRIVADPAEPRSIDFMNDRIGHARGRGMFRIVQKADNRVRSTNERDRVGIDLVKWGLGEKHETPRMFFIEDAQRYGRDPICSEALEPCSTEEEFPGIVWAELKDTRKPDEKPDPKCPDHGENACRYAVNFAWNRDLTPLQPETSYAPFSYGDVLAHNDVTFDENPWIGRCF